MRSTWIVLLVIGVLLFLVSLTADSLGIGEGTGIGWKQITGAVVGVLMAAIGMVQLRKSGAGS
jgi:hypothetical protein